jgi:hypothetical protein
VEPANRRYADPPDSQQPAEPAGPPLTLIGYWEGDHAPGWPLVTDFVDEHWDKTERHRVAFYLEQGFIHPRIAMGISLCRVCGKANGSAERTDGVYQWPEGLAHYVREHGVRPPVSVIRHIISAQDKIPMRANKDWWKTATPDS